jgi:solute carrier family 35 protein E1
VSLVTNLTHQRAITHHIISFQPTMKLSITLTLAALGSSACSAFALSPHHAVSALTKTAQAGPAFVHQPDIKSRDVSISAASGTSNEAITTRGGGDLPIDIPLLTYFGLWYLGDCLIRFVQFSIHIYQKDSSWYFSKSHIGNYYYNVSNKLALKAAGGATGFPLTISALQLGIGSLYGIFLWLAPDARDAPKITMDDVRLLCLNLVVPHVLS